MPSTEAIRPAIWLTWERVMDATAGVPATKMSLGWSIGRSLPRLALIIGQGFEGVCGEIGGKLCRRRELRMLEELVDLRRGAPGEDNCHKGTQEGRYGRSGWWVWAPLIRSTSLSSLEMKGMAFPRATMREASSITAFQAGKQTCPSADRRCRLSRQTGP